MWTRHIESERETQRERVRCFDSRERKIDRLSYAEYTPYRDILKDRQGRIQVGGGISPNPIS